MYINEQVRKQIGLTLFLLGNVLVNIACTESRVVGGEAYLGSDPNNPTAMVFEPAGAVVSYGYSEMYFGMDAALKEGDGIALMFRARYDTGGASDAHLCVVTVEDGVLEVGVGGIRNGSTFEYDKTDVGKTLAEFVGYHKLGCEIVEEDGDDHLKVYLDDVLQVMGTIGSAEIEDNIGVKNDGVVGFAGVDQDEVGISGLRVRSFNFYSEKP